MHTPVAERELAIRQGDEDDGVGWFVAVPALMKPGPVDLTINVPIPGSPCDKKVEESKVSQWRW